MLALNIENYITLNSVWLPENINLITNKAVSGSQARNLLITKVNIDSSVTISCPEYQNSLPFLTRQAKNQKPTNIYEKSLINSNFDQDRLIKILLSDINIKNIDFYKLEDQIVNDFLYALKKTPSI